MSLLINKAIYSILTGDTSVQGYVSGKTYPIFAPDETINPYIVYERKGITATYTKDGLNMDEVDITFYIVSDNYTESVNIANAVRTALELKRGTYAGINIYQCLFSSATETYGVDGFIQTLDFSIKCK